MKLGILKEAHPEKRVAILPEHIKELQSIGIDKIIVEHGAGAGVDISDEAYREAGADSAQRDEILSGCEIILGIHPTHTDGLREDHIHMLQINPLSNPDLVRELSARRLTVFSLDMVPRSTKAQSMDVLSSMATAAGYKAVLKAAVELPRFFPMFMTAAGTIAPAKVLILGAGVAGLQAISTARRLGAVVEAFDVRAAAKEEVLSLGARFVEVEGARDSADAGGYAVEQTEAFKQKQTALIQEHARKADVIICTAQIPGRKAPLLVTEETIHAMKPGSVVVDLAASTGGNCAFTKENETVVVNGVRIIGDSNLPASIPFDASKMYGKNVVNFLKDCITEGRFNIDLENDIIKNTCVTHKGKIVSPRLAERMQ